MPLSIGIVGLPNVGKSTLYNALTNQDAYAANYPFATIEPNTSVVKLHDDRLDFLAKEYNSKKKINSTITFVDIAGIVKGASKGEGLGNKFLSNIREVDAIVHVVRCFKDERIVHVDGKVDPIRDIKTITSELLLSDIEIISKHLNKMKKKLKAGKDKETVDRVTLCEKLLKHMFEEEKPASSLNLTNEELFLLQSFQLLTSKKMIFLLNVGDSDLPKGNENTEKAINFINEKYSDSEKMIFSAVFEAEMAKEEDDDLRKEMAQLVGLEKPMIDIMIRKSFDLLGLRTFFTAGPIEARSWTFKNGMTAKECGGIIHTDIGDKFIKSETFSFDDFKVFKSEQKLKENGKTRMEGKNYIMKDGDVCYFHFNK